jgi:hypothetical protein
MDFGKTLIIILLLHVYQIEKGRGTLFERKVVVCYVFMKMAQWFWERNQLIIYCFTSRSRIFHLYEDVTMKGCKI